MQLTFFAELTGDALATLVARPGVVDDLVSLGARVSVGLVDLTEARAEAVRHLVGRGVPCVAWLLLPEDQGYWLHAGSYHHAQARYAAVRAWSERFGLTWDGLGLDLEPDIALVRALLARPGLTLARRLLARRHEQHSLQALVDLAHADGLAVESYVLPPLGDAKGLSRLLGVVHAEADLEVPMLYGSFVRPWGPAAIASYGREAGAVAIGITGGGVDLPRLSQLAPLSWDELVHDLAVARGLVDQVYLFSLEGCVAHGYLRRLTEDLPAPRVADPVGPAVRLVRRVLKAM